MPKSEQNHLKGSTGKKPAALRGISTKGLWIKLQAYIAILVLAAFALHDFYTQASHQSKNYIAIAGVIAVILLVEKVVRVIK